MFAFTNKIWFKRSIFDINLENVCGYLYSCVRLRVCGSLRSTELPLIWRLGALFIFDYL